MIGARVGVSVGARVGVAVGGVGGRFTIVPSNLTSGGSTTGAASYSTASITPSSNALVLLHVVASKAATMIQPTVTGNGLTWQLVDSTAEFTAGAGVAALYVFRAQGVAPSAGVVAVDFGGVNQTGCVWSVNQFTRADATTANGAAAIVQSVDDTDATVVTINSTLSTFENVKNVNVTCVAIGSVSGGTVTPDAQFAELSDNVIASPDLALETEWAAGEATCDPTFTSAAGVGIVSIEVKAASA